MPKELKKVCYWCQSTYAQESIKLVDSKFLHPQCQQELNLLIKYEEKNSYERVY